jgi:hypothetical protein
MTLPHNSVSHLSLEYLSQDEVSRALQEALARAKSGGMSESDLHGMIAEMNGMITSASIIALWRARKITVSYVNGETNWHPNDGSNDSEETR